MDVYYSFSILIVIATIFSYLNIRFLKLPSTIGIMVIAMLFSIGLVIIGNITTKPLSNISELLSHIDFTQLLMNGMLNFLLFAGAIHINMQDLKEEKIPIIVFSTISVILSTLVVGFLLYYLLNLIFPAIGIHLEIPLIYCLLFGALISPTDPVAVLSILKQAKVSKSLETKVAGESLFNDGVAVVTFSVIYNISVGIETVDLSTKFILELLAKEIFGALIVGFLLGYIAIYAIRKANDYKFAILVTLSVVMGGYLVAAVMHISGPLTMVSSGLIIGNAGRKLFVSGHNEHIGYLENFWELIDEVLNALLFLLIGFELLLIPDLENYWLIGLICIIVVLFARYVSIKIPTLVIPFKENFSKDTITILVWGGLRGGVSIALALSIAEGPYKEIIIAATYFVVVFSIIVQGLSIGKVAHKLNI